MTAGQHEGMAVGAGMVEAFASSDDPVALLNELLLQVSSVTGDMMLPLRVAASALAGRESPAADVAFLLWHLRQAGVLSDGVLAQMGVSAGALEQLGEVASSAPSSGGLSLELEVRAEIEVLERELDALVASSVIAQDDRSIARLVLAEFALSRGLDSLSHAFAALSSADAGWLSSPFRPDSCASQDEVGEGD